MIILRANCAAGLGARAMIPFDQPSASGEPAARFESLAGAHKSNCARRAKKLKQVARCCGLARRLAAQPATRACCPDMSFGSCLRPGAATRTQGPPNWLLASGARQRATPAAGRGPLLAPGSEKSSKRRYTLLITNRQLRQRARASVCVVHWLAAARSAGANVSPICATHFEHLSSGQDRAGG